MTLRANGGDLCSCAGPDECRAATEMPAHRCRVKRRMPFRAKISIELTPPAAAMLLGTIRHINEKKILPADSSQALETSAWLEEIEAAAHQALAEVGLA